MNRYDIDPEDTLRNPSPAGDDGGGWWVVCSPPRVGSTRRGARVACTHPARPAAAQPAAARLAALGATKWA
jgi:hypothetical protein